MRAGVLASCVHSCILSAWKQCLPPEDVKCMDLMQTFPVRASDYLSQFTVILACSLLPPFLVTFPCYPGGSVNSSFCLALPMKQLLTYFSFWFFCANLPFLLMTSPCFFKPSSISFYSLHLQPFKFSFQMPLHPRLQNEIQSEKPGIQCSVQHDLKSTFLFLFLLMSGFCSPTRWAGIQTNRTNGCNLFVSRVVLPFLFCVPSL